MKRVYRIMLLFLLAAVLFTACSAQAQPDVPNVPSPAVSDGNSSDTPAPDEPPGKITLTLAGVGMRTYGWDRLAEAFNAQSEDYIVELRDYYAGSFVDDGTGVPDDMEQYRADLADAQTRLHTALIAGKTPDMLVLDGLSPLTYLGKGLLLDLDPYAEADADISPEDILCWDALHEYGGLYILARQFVVETLMCSQAFYDAHRGWTVADYLEIEQGLRADQQMIYYMSPEEFLTQMGGQYLTKALDLAHASCDFDNPEFIAILNGADPVYFGSPVYAPRMREQTAQQNADGGKYTTASEADIEAYIAAARACPAMAYRDEAVMTIIQEECAPLLRGEGPAADAAKRIQSRASLYMTEQYG